MIEKTIQKLFGIDKIISYYKSLNQDTSPLEFTEEALSGLDIDFQYVEDHLERISSSGPLIIVANHPFGCVEGIILARLLLKVRKDIKILSNPVLKAFTQLSPVMLYTSPYKTKEAFQENISATKQAFTWLQDGGSLAMFPAGNVSHITWGKWKVRDQTWSPSFVRMLRKTKANVIPIYFHGKNSNFFQAAGLIHPKLRTLLLAREFMKKKGSTIQVSIGKKIANSKIPFELSDEEITAYFRFRTYTLGKEIHSELENTPLANSKPKAASAQVDIAPHRGSNLLQEEVDQLPNHQTLVETKEHAVYYIKPQQCRHLLDEIGRLREKSFRRVGCGTGKALDLDDYDTYYSQLFLWNKKRSEMVGGYRVGQSDLIIKNQGIEKMYTRKNFTYSQVFFDRIG